MKDALSRLAAAFASSRLALRRARPAAARLSLVGTTFVATILVALGACTEEPLSTGIEAAPGTTVPTVEVIVPVTELPSWRDTTLTGFATASNASFLLVSNTPPVVSRVLGRFDVPDTIRTFVDTLPVATFEEVELLVRMDTTRSLYQSLPVTIRLLDLGERFDPGSATWRQASDGAAWSAPGGDFGAEIASGVLEAVSDTLLLQLSVAEDSLMRAWQAEDGGNGFALVVDGPETTLRVTGMALRYDPTLVGRQLPVPQSQLLELRTFIYDPPHAPPGTELRLGGLPASRFYIDFSTPEMAGGHSLAQGTINHAEIILHPLPAPEPHAAERAIEARRISLLADPFVAGEKTPIGGGGARLFSLDPALLESGEPLRIDITPLISHAVRESRSAIRLGFRGEPDAQTLGYWGFGSIESPVDVRPALRLIFSPAPDFPIP